jgi:hypothetical protein
MDIFAPGRKRNTSFIVRNISPQNKTINIFQYPINMDQTRDLLAIPGVSDGDIRSSLLKGEVAPHHNRILKLLNMPWNAIFPQ